MNVRKYGKYLSVTVCILVICFTFIFFCNVYPLKYTSFIKKYASSNGIEPKVIASIINTESSFKAEVVSSKGAVGLMQILPDTAKWITEQKGINYEYISLKNAEDNIKIGCLYFAYLLNKFGHQDTAIVAYNAGEGNVSTWLKNASLSSDGKTLKAIPFKESKEYLKKVKSAIRVYGLRL